MATTKWISDPAHSEVQFKIKHLLISNVTGFFRKFSITMETTGNDFTGAKIKFVAAVNAIDTNNEQRDEHLKTADFFDMVNYPEIIFEGLKMDKIDDGNYKLYGNFIIKDISKAIVLDVEFGGRAEDRFGNTHAGFTLTGKINRRDFGLGPDNPGLGNEIMLQSNLQVVKQV
ncbi:YceI family protein [Taibaiella chishuiensis]|uniref:Polyisoprenoid-binding protein YceI n=1 Tax=Taibaiella chishuiensis TaxID=1434707 RepID=A0A2P8D2Z0_9BACT|nr:YceI family protein [Taibaiella chishuiensis]PSK91549.1 polyisoprenoid-binding protein YceI [Taibaiella chishuiensis]